MTAFGYQPVRCIVHLTEGGDFDQQLLTPDGADWPVGAAISLVLSTVNVTTWTAAITGPSAVFHQDAAVTTAELVPEGTKARVVYTDNAGNELVWFTGVVTRHG